MEIMKSFNETVRYIESVLDSEIDESKVAYLSTYSYAMFSRLFSILTDMTLSEYIRFRRLTRAAIEIRESNARVIDLAMKYGYESSDSFTNAFKSFHDVTPTEVRNGKAYKFVSPIQLAIRVSGGKHMEVRIERKESVNLVGIKLGDIESSSSSDAWDKLYSMYDHEKLAALGSGQSYGVCFDLESTHKINYMAAYDIKDIDQAGRLGLDSLKVEAADYAVLKIRGSVPNCILEGWKYVFEVFFPEEAYKHSGKPDFEVYSEGDMSREDYEMELWIPIKNTREISLD